MITLDYINGNNTLMTESVFQPFELFLNESMNDVKMESANFQILSNKFFTESEIMGDLPEDHKLCIAMEAAQKSLLEKIGDAVIAIFKQFEKLIDNICDTIKNFAIKKKTDVQKMEMMLDRHPEFKDEVVCAFNKGAMDLSDVKSLKELDKAFDDIMEMSKKADVDPKTLKGKWQKAVDKFNEDEKSWKMVKVAAAATTVITAAIAIKTFNGKCLDAKNRAQKDKIDMEKRKNTIYNRLKDDPNSGINKDSGKYETMLAMWRELNGKHSAARKENLSRLEKLSNSITKFLDSHTSKDSREKFHGDRTLSTEIYKKNDSKKNYKNKGGKS